MNTARKKCCTENNENGKHSIFGTYQKQEEKILKYRAQHKSHRRIYFYPKQNKNTQTFSMYFT